MEVERAVGEPEQVAGHDPPVVGEHDEVRVERPDCPERVRAQAGRRQDGPIPRSVAGTATRSGRPVRAGGPRRGRDDPHQGDVGCSPAVAGRPAECRRAQEDDPNARAAAAVDHARALVGSRTSASASSSPPDGISSSIESR